MHAHANARTRTCSREQEESQDCALSTDFGSNAERTDEVGMQEEPSWLSEVMSLISRATDRVFADETAASESESESAPRSSGWIPDWATMMTGDQPAFGPASAYVVDAGSAAVAENGAGNSGPQGAFPTVADGASYNPRGTLGQVHAAHERRLADGIELSLGMRERDLGLFQAHYERHRARYEAVSARTDMPPKLIAALHWRESSGNFNTYLHQGCLLYTSPSPRDKRQSRMPSSA